MKTRKKKALVNVITLGCSKNLVDSEVLLKQFNANGITYLHDADTYEADTVIINTCGFIKDAKEESINTILGYIRAKEQGLIGKVFVMGCLSERYKQELSRDIPEVDKYFGVNNIRDIIQTLGYNYKDNLLGERVITTPSHYAYLKVSEGCDRQCSFCSIPLIRGRHLSKPIEVLVSEARNLIDQGVKEIILIAQDLTYYGVDLYKKQKLGELLEQLADLEKLEWIRLHYAYPAGFPENILRVIRDRENICNYLDIPFQHISDSVLKNMRRGISAVQTYTLIEKLRKSIPGLVLRTTLMTGHPGEGDKEFGELIEFVEKIKFERLGVFTYCQEEGTFGAENLKDDLDEEIKKARAEKIMLMQGEISLTMNKQKLGKTINVIVDRREGDYWIGRTASDSPEVDNEVLISTEKILSIGSFYKVTITGAEEHDLFASIA